MLVIGSRGSPLALWQAEFITRKLQTLGVETRIQVIKTTGDHLQTASLVQAGGKGLFTKEIEEALLSRAIDIAVHSLKDLPTEHPPGLAIAAIPEREDPRDAMIGSTLVQLAAGARVGTSSNRRGSQLRLLRPDLHVEPIRGNVDTRLRKLAEGQFDAILLAAAGLRRLGLEERIAQVFTPREICPAPGQGALAIQTREHDGARDLCARLEHRETADCVGAERMVLSALGGGCQLPVGAFADIEGGTMHISAVAVSPDASSHLRVERSGARESHAELAASVAAELLKLGAGSLLAAAS